MKDFFLFIHQPYTLLHTCVAPSTIQVSPISMYSSTIHTASYVCSPHQPYRSLLSPFIHEPYTLLHTCVAPSTIRVSPISIYSSTIRTVQGVPKKMLHSPFFQNSRKPEYINVLITHGKNAMCLGCYLPKNWIILSIH